MSETKQPPKVSILLVDDQPARLLSYKAILQGLGHNLVTARSGADAMQRLLEEEFAVILLDVSMPEMDGFELATLVHEHPRFEKTPIIFVTGLHVTDLDRLRGYAVGAVDYVYVPVVPEILRCKVSVLTELFLKRKELQALNRSFERANAELQEANTSLRAEKTQELEAANRELAQANGILQAEVAERNRLEVALREADRRKDEFLAMLAHELRNPLAPILNAVQFMRLRASDDPKLTWCRDVIERQAGHLTHLVDDLLDVSRITQGKINLQLSNVALDAVIGRAIESNLPFIDARRHEVTVDLPPGPVHVRGDLTRLAQIVGNLVNNAAKYTGDGGAIRVSVEVVRGPGDAEEAHICVRDNGIGIPTDMLHRVFELFTQVEQPVDSGSSGLGIGLALVHRLVELHGGRVEAHSPGLGRGSEFVVALPVQQVPSAEGTGVSQVAPGSAPADAAPAREPTPAQSPLRILVVDDNQDSAESLGLLLSHMGHEVETAFSGRDGIRAVTNFEPDIVFLDLGMPDFDGYEAAHRILGLPRARAIKLVALTGYSQPEDRRRTKEAGFDHHLVKPIERKDLDAVLGRLRVASPPSAAAGARIVSKLGARDGRASQPSRHPVNDLAWSTELQQIAHDLRSPLNALWGTSSLLLETSLDASQRDYAKTVRSCAESIRRLADDIAFRSNGGLAPAAWSHSAASSTAGEASVEGEETTGAVEPLRILVVDDDPLNRTAMLQVLTNLGHSCESARDGGAAIAVIEENDFDVVLMDLQMSGICGLEAVRSIRGRFGRARIPLILGMTGTALAADRDAGLAAGMDEVLVKPVEAETLRLLFQSGSRVSAKTTATPAESNELLDTAVVTSLRAQRSAPGRPLLNVLVDLFATDTPEQIAELREAVACSDASRLMQTAHRLKGSSGLIGAKTLGALASVIEMLARAGDGPGAASVVAELEQAWPATRDALASATAQPSR